MDTQEGERKPRVSAHHGAQIVRDLKGEPALDGQVSQILPGTAFPADLARALVEGRAGGTVMAQIVQVSPRPTPEFLFQTLTVEQSVAAGAGRGASVAVSMAAHALMVAAIVLVPVLYYDVIPEPSESIMKAFFVSPAEVAPAPPPPPPPAPAFRATKAPAPIAPPAPAAFVAPIEAPEGIQREEGLDLGLGVEGGVPGGVEGGVPGGVLGGIVGGVMPPPAPVARVVRVGGQLTAPKLIKKVAPEYPDLARVARLGALLIMEAHVDTRGAVKSVTILRGHPLFDEAAIAAVQQWRYRPLLLNGEPTEFILTVTLTFDIRG